MKGLILFVFALILLSSVSCRKDWSCVCNNSSTVHDTIQVSNQTKSAAESTCEAKNADYATTAPTTRCSLK